MIKLIKYILNIFNWDIDWEITDKDIKDNLKL